MEVFIRMDIRKIGPLGSALFDLQQVAGKRGMEGYFSYGVNNDGEFFMSLENCRVSLGCNVDSEIGMLSPVTENKLAFATHFCNNAERLDLFSITRISGLVPGVFGVKTVRDYFIYTSDEYGKVTGIFYIVSGQVYMYNFVTEDWDLFEVWNEKYRRGREANGSKNDKMSEVSEIQVHSLWASDEPLGYRITVGDEAYDVSIEKAKQYGLNRTDNRLQMKKLKSGMWVSQSEYVNRKLVADISDNDTKIAELVNMMCNQG